jgi:CRISPR/Cas system-associated endonuclease Cas1
VAPSLTRRCVCEPIAHFPFIIHGPPRKRLQQYIVYSIVTRAFVVARKLVKEKLLNKDTDGEKHRQQGDAVKNNEEIILKIR